MGLGKISVLLKRINLGGWEDGASASNITIYSILIMELVTEHSYPCLSVELTSSTNNNQG